MKNIEKQILDFLKEQYTNDRKQHEGNNQAEGEISFFFQGMINGINLCVEKLNCEVSEEFTTECNKFLDELMEEA